MLITVQFPFVDLRQFVDGPQRLPLPAWPVPELPGFVRSFGPICSRKGFLDWIPEPFACNARRACYPSEITVPLPRRKNANTVFALRPVAKRLFFDGRAMGKLELLFRSRSGTFPLLQDLTDDLLLKYVSETPVLVRLSKAGGGVQPLTLGKLATLFPQQWVEATSRKGAPSGDKHCVHVGNANVLVAMRRSQMLHIDSARERWELLDGNGGGPSVRICRVVPKKQGPFSHMWTIESQSYSSSLSRELRVTLLRFDAEFFALKRVLTLIGKGNISPTARSVQSDALQKYLTRACDEVLALTLKKHPRTSQVVQAVHAIYLESLSGEAELIVEKLRDSIDVRRNVIRKVEETLQPAATNIFVVKGDLKVSKYNFEGKVDAGMIGDQQISGDANINVGGQQVKMSSVVQDLDKILEALKDRTLTKEQQEEAEQAKVARAEAAKGNTGGVLAALGKCGKWLLDIAKEVGADIASKVIAKQLGLGG